MSRNEKIVILMVVVFLVLGVTSLLRKSPTCDEVGHHVASGYVFLTKADFAFSTEAPPLARYLMSVPMLFMNIDLPADRSFWAREDRAEFSREFLYGNNRELAGKIFFFARLPMLLIGCLGGCFLFFWVRRRYDENIAVLATFFYFLSPNILAHARLATTDIVATVFIMCSVLSFWDFYVHSDRKHVLVAGSLLGLALLSKFSALVLLPVYFIMVIFSVAKIAYLGHGGKAIKFLLNFLACLFVAVIVLWGGYAFEFRPLLVGVMRVEWKEAFFVDVLTKILTSGGREIIGNYVKLLYQQPIPLSSYVMGIAGIVRHGIGGSRVYFMGVWSLKGHPLYYLTAFLIKTPVPVIAGFVTGIFVLVRSKRKLALTSYLLGIILLYFIAASRSDLQLGLRYVLPVYPLIFIIAAIGINSFLQSKYFRRVLVILLLAWMVGVNFYIWPDYLSYFNELVGGPKNGYKYLRDSNVDWGQDLPALKSFMVANDIDSVKLSYFGEADPSCYGIGYQEISEEEQVIPDKAVYAISVNHLDNYQWVVGLEPDAYAGYSIYIYDFREKR